MGIQRLNEVIDERSMRTNEVFRKKNNNDRSMTIGEKSRRKIGYTEHIADKLVQIYDAPGSRSFFLKCAWHLSEDQIWSAVESSRRGRVKSPVKYFVAICHKALREMPVTN